MTDKHEPLLQPLGDGKYVFTCKLDENKDIYDLYKKQQACFWTPPEIDMANDKVAFEKMTPDEQHFFKHILAFFAGSDIMVNENIQTRFLEDCDIPIVKACYNWQMAMEDVHSETYSLLLQTIVPNRQEQDRLMNAISTIPTIGAKMAFAKKFMTCDCDFRYRVVAFIIMEGVFFSASFCAIFWNKSKGGSLAGLISANNFIARDEGMHCEMGCLMYDKLKYKLTEKEIHNMFNKAFDIEREFICDAIPCRMIGMNSDSMTEYVQFICDFWLVRLGYNKLFNVANPYSFMDSINLETKANFFEFAPAEYSRAEKEHTFEMDADF
jgi:ribonucleotide reductase beta subunit family protein with ferritin-like domain